ncbi:hypothetical protein CHS0354_020132 [Potamilus streckersoni]|uniref:Uncharacterized protein n=1 Tax=Potamilus streckersoni TaxID=2493646 RepID=A0AAE0S5P7_9BIVA|nr:hypothetical protein CHS0354_020132 [Potamilus streckersoni]
MECAMGIPIIDFTMECAMGIAIIVFTMECAMGIVIIDFTMECAMGSAIIDFTMECAMGISLIGFIMEFSVHRSHRFYGEGKMSPGNVRERKKHGKIRGTVTVVVTAVVGEEKEEEEVSKAITTYIRRTLSSHYSISILPMPHKTNPPKQIPTNICG